MCRCCRRLIYNCWAGCIIPTCGFYGCCRFPHGCCYTVMAILAAFGGVFMNMYVIMSCFFQSITELHPTTGEPLPSSKRGYGMMSRQISYGEEPSYMQCVYYPEEEAAELFDPWMKMAKASALVAAALAFISFIILFLACCCKFSKPTFERWLLWMYIWAAIFISLAFLMYGGHFCKDNLCKVAEGSGYAISCFLFYLVNANTVKSMGQPPPSDGNNDDDDKGDQYWYNNDDERFGRAGRGGNDRSRYRDDDSDGSSIDEHDDDEYHDDQYDDGDERNGRKHRNQGSDGDGSHDDDDFEDFDDEFDEEDADRPKRNGAVSGSRSRGTSRRSSNGMSDEVSDGGWEDASDSLDTGSGSYQYNTNNNDNNMKTQGDTWDGLTRRQNQFGEPIDEYGVTRPKQEKDAALHSGTYKPPQSSRHQHYQLPPPQYQQPQQRSGDVQLTELGAHERDEIFDNDSFFGARSRASHMTGRSRGTADPPASASVRSSDSGSRYSRQSNSSSRRGPTIT